MADLKQRVVAYLESRRADEMASIIQRHGGVPYGVPCLREVVDPQDPAARLAVDAMCAKRTEVVVFLTGKGAEATMEIARAHGRLEELLGALTRKMVVVRGPKPLRSLRRVGVPVALTAPEPFTSYSLLEALKALDFLGRAVVVQGYGGSLSPDVAGDPAPMDVLCDGLRAMGAEVTVVFPYRWELPEEARLVEFVESLEAGKIHAVAATNAQQIHHLFTFCRSMGFEEVLRSSLAKVVVASQGPISTEAWNRYGVRVDVVARHGHMGALVLDIAEHFERLVGRSDASVEASDSSGARRIPNS